MPPNDADEEMDVISFGRDQSIVNLDLQWYCPNCSEALILKKHMVIQLHFGAVRHFLVAVLAVIKKTLHSVLLLVKSLVAQMKETLL